MTGGLGGEALSPQFSFVPFAANQRRLVFPPLDKPTRELTPHRSRIIADDAARRSGAYALNLTAPAPVLSAQPTDPWLF